MPRPEVEKKNPVTVKKGTVIRLPNNGIDEVVRSVSVVLHMANGQDVSYSEGDEVSVLAEQPLLQPDENG